MENINEVVREAVFMAIKEYDRSREEKGRRKILYNTKLLLKNYNELKNHSENAIYKHIDNEEIDKAFNSEEANYSDDMILIESIKNNRAKTLIMIEHIDMALGRAKRNQQLKETEEKYRALEMFYIQSIRKEAIALKLNCNVRSISRWIKEVEEDVSINLFGIQSIEYSLY